MNPLNPSLNHEDLEHLEQSTHQAFHVFKCAWEKQKSTYEKIIQGYEKNSQASSSSNGNRSDHKVPNGIDMLLKWNESLELEVQSLKIKLERKRKLALYLYQQKEKWKRLASTSSTTAGPSLSLANLTTLKVLDPPSTHLLPSFPATFSPISEKHPSSTHLPNLNLDHPALDPDPPPPTNTSNLPPQQKENVKYPSSLRTKQQRQQMHASDCSCCEQWYQHFPSAQHQQHVSRHRTFHEPPSTPDGFWDLGFPQDS
ncbi:DNA endonuclease rbbp8 [Coelomomyces lativittatus]|nr:DNA endonuclease rbbp8 [Coelomomyces lativittatus]